MKKTDNELDVITIFPGGTRVKFRLKFSDFAKTLKRDSADRLNMWMDADNDKPYKEFYFMSNVSFNFQTKELEMVELTPVDKEKNGR